MFGLWPCMMSHPFSKIYRRLNLLRLPMDLLWPFVSHQLLLLYIWQMVNYKKNFQNLIIWQVLSSAILVDRWLLVVSIHGSTQPLLGFHTMWFCKKSQNIPAVMRIAKTQETHKKTVAAEILEGRRLRWRWKEPMDWVIGWETKWTYTKKHLIMCEGTSIHY